MKLVKEMIKGFPPTKAASRQFWKLRNSRAPSVSRPFWEHRYSEGGTSGPGSYGALCEFKSTATNEILLDHAVSSVIDFGCGDGNQIRGLSGVDYLGIDVSQDAVDRCHSLYADDKRKRFIVADRYANETAELALSIDVIFHLVEDDVFEQYMNRLFESAERLVLIYSSNFDQLCLNPFASPVHVRHRAFSQWITQNAPEWKLEKKISNPYKRVAGTTARTHSLADFYLYIRA